jgi:hypothetical protein
MFGDKCLVVCIVVLLLGLFGPGSALASVKCQCNNGIITHDMSTDYDDDDVEEAWNDACSESGGGRVWKPEIDGGDGDDVSVRHRRGPVKRGPRR